MLHLVDNDVVLKLARYDLLDKAMAHWQGHERVRRLGTCLYSLCPHPIERALKRCGKPEVIKRIEAFCEQVLQIPSLSDVDMLSRIANVPAIDEGEALILAYAAQDLERWTYTADKRCIVALHESAGLDDIRTLLVGRTYCFEHLVALVIIQEGLDVVVEAIRSDPAADTALRAIVGTANPASLDSTWEGLQSYYSDLRGKTGALLAAFPAKPDQANGSAATAV